MKCGRRQGGADQRRVTGRTSDGKRQVRPPTAHLVGAALPVARNRCDHFTTLATLNLKVARDRSAALTRRNRRHNALAKIKGISSGRPMLGSNPASILNHIRAKPGILPIQKKTAAL